MIITTLGANLCAISVKRDLLSVIVMSIQTILVPRSVVPKSSMSIMYRIIMKKISIDMNQDQINYETIAESQQFDNVDDDQYDDYPEFDVEYTTDYY
jgi:hypothetical protein